METKAAPVALTYQVQFAATEQLDSLADNTRRSYLGALRRLACFGIDAPGDLVDETLSGAIRSMTSDGYAFGTIAVAAARWVARTLGRVDPCGPRSRAAQRKSARQAAPQQTAVPLVWGDADTAAQIAAADNTGAGLRDAAIIAVMSDAMLRRSEAAALMWSDLDIDSDGVRHPRRATLEDGSDWQRIAPVFGCRDCQADRGVGTGLWLRRATS